jgi:hypothetical protein
MQDPNITTCINLDSNIVVYITPDPTFVAITTPDAALYSAGNYTNSSDLNDIGGLG